MIAGCEHDARPVVVQREREGQDAPCQVALFLLGRHQQSPVGPINIGLPGSRDVQQHLPPVPQQRHLVEDASPRKPVPRVTEIFRRLVIAEVPHPAIIKDLHQHVGADRMRNPRVEEVSRIDNDRASSALCLKRTQGMQQVAHGAVPLQQVHILNPAERIARASPTE